MEARIGIHCAPEGISRSSPGSTNPESVILVPPVARQYTRH
jgi:hypothetical protein